VDRGNCHQRQRRHDADGGTWNRDRQNWGLGRWAVLGSLYIDSYQKEGKWIRYFSEVSGEYNS